ncbi:hypothetical protein RchiOBHm_Chr6g0277191 [Rosa chinensis]|uniref:Uncharacterized protein n=1 Tax=Rosa chinensis TaxID=74649 RepID=A0A2P6PSF5_ROSCH|nr:hypothetical protein RchiOBHm_Chr6g0277191 [Rosa chinensis]
MHFTKLHPKVDPELANSSVMNKCSSSNFVMFSVHPGAFSLNCSSIQLMILAFFILWSFGKNLRTRG